MELGWGGERPVQLDDGSRRTWLEDGDTVTIRAWCGNDTRTANDVDLGAVTGRVFAARDAAG